MSTRHDNADGPEDIDAAFAEIVAGLERDAPMSRWPAEDAGSEQANTGRAETDTGRTDGASTGSAAVEPRPESAASPIEPAEPAGPRDWTPFTEDEGHYDPPEPPPMPPPRPTTIGGIAVIGIGVVLLLVPGLAGLGSTVALPMGLVAISAGISWLLFRIRQSPPDPDDDGAQL
ncbi:hypothetical protein [Parasphingorhabdus pacifica]